MDTILPLTCFAVCSVVAINGDTTGSACWLIAAVALLATGILDDIRKILEKKEKNK